MRPEVMCKLVGHQLDADASYYYSLDVCKRCGRELHHPLRYEHLMVRIRIGCRWIAERLNWFKEFFTRCPECGLRFHRHDDRFDHLPF